LSFAGSSAVESAPLVDAKPFHGCADDSVPQ